VKSGILITKAVVLTLYVYGERTDEAAAVVLIVPVGTK
jgi:hypothetical protein